MRPYVKADGTEVRGHVRRLPDLAGTAGGGLLLLVAVILIISFGTHGSPGTAAPASGASPGAGSPHKTEGSAVYPIKWPAWDKLQQEAAERTQQSVTYPVGQLLPVALACAPEGLLSGCEVSGGPVVGGKSGVRRASSPMLRCRATPLTNAAETLPS
ncbi:hypothetical protein GCM10010326_77890 [Streptomyces xanthochromogenes]|uniref:Uncharacterized protein n=1 Tax=Streptomyces xanthochromogenes TaxID=67384 RepID=A0ABQ3AZJ3_9ACTN|nr:hypothetical protein GCM10010326_77890 [Streptomyces xanthochromogenes]